MKTITASPSRSELKLKPFSFPLPPVTGVIDRRMLVNFRCDPELLARWLPPPFRPRLVQGWGLAGLCLIRLRNIRPRGWPSQFGFASENAAHRIAVTWDESGQTRQGVFVLRRDTNSPWNKLAGGRIFPGIHHSARFTVWETPHRFKLTMQSDDGAARIRVVARLGDMWTAHSIFPTLADASAFFAAGRLGWSESRHPGRVEALVLDVRQWTAEALTPERVESSFFQDTDAFPAGSATLDNILLQRGLEHEWHAPGCAECGQCENRLETMRLRPSPNQSTTNL